MADQANPKDILPLVTDILAAISSNNTVAMAEPADADPQCL